MSMVVRPVHSDDLEDLYALALSSGYGLTTFPKDKCLLSQRIEQSILSFNDPLTPIEDTYYLFVLEDTARKKVVGTSAIAGKIGVTSPFYSFEHHKKIKKNSALGIESLHDYLTLSFKNRYSTELCTLYLDPAYRKNGNGYLLSKARFFYLYHHPDRFCSTIIAELRGFLDDQGHSLFWDKVMKPFFNISFHEADALTTISDKSFITALLPEHPIYLNFFSKRLRALIGRPHLESKAAYHMLEKEGFRFNNTVDIFDAGPTLSADIKKIKMIQSIKTLPYVAQKTMPNATKALVCHTDHKHFRVIFDVLSFNETHCHILDVTVNDLQLYDQKHLSFSQIL